MPFLKSLDLLEYIYSTQWKVHSNRRSVQSNVKTPLCHTNTKLFKYYNATHSKHNINRTPLLLILFRSLWLSEWAYSIWFLFFSVTHLNTFRITEQFFYKFLAVLFSSDKRLIFFILVSNSHYHCSFTAFQVYFCRFTVTLQLNNSKTAFQHTENHTESNYCCVRLLNVVAVVVVSFFFLAFELMILFDDNHWSFCFKIWYLCACVFFCCFAFVSSFNLLPHLNVHGEKKYNHCTFGPIQNSRSFLNTLNTKRVSCFFCCCCCYFRTYATWCEWPDVKRFNNQSRKKQEERSWILWGLALDARYKCWYIQVTGESLRMKVDQLTKVVFRRVVVLFTTTVCIFVWLCSSGFYDCLKSRAFKYLHAFTLIRMFHVWLVCSVRSVWCFLFTLFLVYNIHTYSNLFSLFFLLTLFFFSILFFSSLLSSWILCCFNSSFVVICVRVCVFCVFTYQNQKCTHSKYNDRTV